MVIKLSDGRLSCTHYNHSPQSYKIFDYTTKKSQKNIKSPLYVASLYKNTTLFDDLHFFSNNPDLVKKNETMLIVYKNKLNHFEVCICNSKFAPS